MAAPAGPETRYQQRESISLAFVRGLQILPPRQLAVLILRDVLGFHADEVAEMLDTTVESVNSVLKRARAGLDGQRQSASPPGARAVPEQAMVAKFVSAYEAADIDSLVALLTDDVFMSMSPIPLEYLGRGPVRRFLATLFGAGRRYDLMLTRANGQPAFAAYLRTGSGPHPAIGLYTLTLRGDGISELSRFEESVLPWFGMPLSLPTR